MTIIDMAKNIDKSGWTIYQSNQNHQKLNQLINWNTTKPTYINWATESVIVYKEEFEYCQTKILLHILDQSYLLSPMYHINRVFSLENISLLQEKYSVYWETIFNKIRVGRFVYKIKKEKTILLRFLTSPYEAIIPHSKTGKNYLTKTMSRMLLATLYSYNVIEKK